MSDIQIGDEGSPLDAEANKEAVTEEVFAAEDLGSSSTEAMTSKDGGARREGHEVTIQSKDQVA